MWFARGLERSGRTSLAVDGERVRLNDLLAGLAVFLHERQVSLPFRPEVAPYMTHLELGQRCLEPLLITRHDGYVCTAFDKQHSEREACTG